MDTDIAREIERARDAAQRRDRKTARAILRKVLEQEPRNLEGWLLYAEVAQKDAHAVQCLERVLRIDPDNETARQKLASLYTPSQSYLTRVQRKAAADPYPALHQLREEFASQSSYEQEESGIFTLPDGETAGVLLQDENPTLPARNRRTTWFFPGKLEFAILAMTACMGLSILAGLGLAFLTASTHFRSQAAQSTSQVQPSLEDLTSILDQGIRALNTEDLPAYMATIHPGSPVYTRTQDEIGQSFQTYDLSYELSDVQIVEQNDREVRLRFVQVTRKLRGPDYHDNRATWVVILRLDHGAWKIYDRQNEKTEYLK